MNTRHSLLVLGLAAPLALSGTAPASASIFGDIGHAVGSVTKKVSRTVEKVTKPVGRTVEKAAKDVGHAVGSASKDVGHAAADIGRGAVKTVKAAPKVYMQMAKPVGVVVAKTYNTAAQVMDHTPLKVFSPITRDIARAARTNEAKIGAVVGAGTVLLGGGLPALLHHGGTAAGAGAMTAYYGKQGYEKGKATVNAYGQKWKQDVREVRDAAR